MCIAPLTLKRPKEEWMLDIDGTHTRVVPCGKCFQCKNRRSAAWAFRLEQEQKKSTSSFFITLTYADTPTTMNGHMTLEKKDFQKFMKRLRKQNETKLKYYACGEYGEQYNRPHYHIILFNLNGNIRKILQKTWKKGIVDIGTAEPGSIRYVTNYLCKSKWKRQGELDDRQEEFSLMSKGMGKAFLTEKMQKYLQTQENGFIIKRGGEKLNLPRYYKDTNLGTRENPRKLFSEKQRYLISQEQLELSNDYITRSFKDHGTEEHIQWKKNKLREHRKTQLLQRMQF